MSHERMQRQAAMRLAATTSVRTVAARSCSFPLWGKAGMGAGTPQRFPAPQAPTPTLPQRGRERMRGREGFA